MIACGLDFGTSNSAIGVARDRATALAPLEGSNTLMPSAVFFDYETKGRVLFGSDAIAADTRFCTRTCAKFRSVPISNVTISE